MESVSTLDMQLSGVRAQLQRQQRPDERAMYEDQHMMLQVMQNLQLTCYEDLRSCNVHTLCACGMGFKRVVQQPRSMGTWGQLNGVHEACIHAIKLRKCAAYTSPVSIACVDAGDAVRIILGTA